MVPGLGIVANALGAATMDSSGRSIWSRSSGVVEGGMAGILVGDDDLTCNIRQRSHRLRIGDTIGAAYSPEEGEDKVSQGGVGLACHCKVTVDPRVSSSTLVRRQCLTPLFCRSHLVPTLSPFFLILPIFLLTMEPFAGINPHSAHAGRGECVMMISTMLHSATPNSS